MPVTYEAPEPGGSSIAEEYGRLNQQNRKAEFSLKVEEARAAASARDQTNANDISKMNAQVNMAEEENRLRSQTATAQMQTGMNERQMGIDAQAASQQREFNYADNIRLQNLQQQRSSIENDSNLTPQERQQMLGMVDPNISALQFRQKQTQMQQEQAQTRRIASQQAHQDGLDAIHRQQVGQQGTAGHYRIPDPNDATGQTALPGWYQRNRHGETELVAGTAPGHGHASSGGSAGSAGAPSAQLNSAINHATSYVEQELRRTPEQGGLPLDHADRSNPQAFIERIARQHNAVSQALIPEEREHRARIAGGPLPFDIPPATAPDVNGIVQNAMQRTINTAITRAEGRNAPRESEALRGIAAEINTGKTTGDLAPQQQQLLSRAGYYSAGFTPTIDRQISAAIQPRPEVMNQGGQRVVMQRRPSPEMQQAAQDFRTILAAYDGPPPESRRNARQRYDELRGRLGFNEWPPPLSVHSDQPPRAIAPPEPAPPQQAAPQPGGFMIPGLVE